MSDTSTKVTFNEYLPEDIKQNIFSYLDHRTLRNARGVCKNWLENITQLPITHFINLAIEMIKSGNIPTEYFLRLIKCKKAVVEKAILEGFSPEAALDPWLSTFPLTSYIDVVPQHPINLIKSLIKDNTFDTHISAIKQLKKLTNTQLYALSKRIPYKAVINFPRILFTDRHVDAMLQDLKPGEDLSYELAMEKFDRVKHLSYVEAYAFSLNLKLPLPPNFSVSHIDVLLTLRKQNMSDVEILEKLKPLSDAAVQAISLGIPDELIPQLTESFNFSHVEAIQKLIKNGISNEIALQQIKLLNKKQVYAITCGIPYDKVLQLPKDFKYSHIDAIAKLQESGIPYEKILGPEQTLTKVQLYAVYKGLPIDVISKLPGNFRKIDLFYAIELFKTTDKTSKQIFDYIKSLNLPDKFNRVQETLCTYGFSFAEITRILPITFISPVPASIIDIYVQLCVLHNEPLDAYKINEILTVYNLTPNYNEINVSIRLSTKLCAMEESRDIIYNDNIKPKQFLDLMLTSKDLNACIEKIFQKCKHNEQILIKPELADFTFEQFICFKSGMPITMVKQNDFDLFLVLLLTDENKSLDMEKYKAYLDLAKDNVAFLFLKETFPDLNIPNNKDLCDKFATLLIYGYAKNTDFSLELTSHDVEKLYFEMLKKYEHEQTLLEERLCWQEIVHKPLIFRGSQAATTIGQSDTPNETTLSALSHQQLKPKHT